MRRALIAVSTLMVVFLAGCPKTYKDGKCETSKDCAAQEGYGKVCVQGLCQECGADIDCKAGFVCRSNKCVPQPECESSADCATGKSCQDGKCVATGPAACGPGGTCPEGMTCSGGVCVAGTTPPAESGECATLQSVYFAFDSSDLTAESRSALDQDYKCMSQKGTKALRVEGNCDERGTAEYNMHLGQRRADAVKKYLEGLGAAAKEIKTISYGKEKPVCTEATEECWQKCRRADLKSE